MSLPGSVTFVARRILLVDDEPIVRDSIQKFLQFDGHHVAVAGSGEEALALLQRSSFDVVITDYEMPGMKGNKLAAAIKMILPLQPVLLISAYGEQLRTPADPMSAVDTIITKPFHLDELRQAIATLVLKPACVLNASTGHGFVQPRL